MAQHPDNDICLRCNRKRYEHVEDMIFRTGSGICFDFYYLYYLEFVQWQ